MKRLMVIEICEEEGERIAIKAMLDRQFEDDPARAIAVMVGVLVDISFEIGESQGMDRQQVANLIGAAAGM